MKAKTKTWESNIHDTNEFRSLTEVLQFEVHNTVNIWSYLKFML